MKTHTVVTDGDAAIARLCEGVEKGDWVWCKHCERTYQVGTYALRISDDLQHCPFPGCDGDALTDAFLWENVQASHPQYPKIPQAGQHYPKE